MFVLSPLLRGAFPPLPSPLPSPLPKLLHPLSVSDAEVLHLIKQRREEREGRLGHCKTQNVEGRKEGTALVGGIGQVLGKAKNLRLHHDLYHLSTACGF